MTMVCPSSVVAHLAKFIVTIACMITLRDPFGKTSPWSFRAFQILLLHSILGILRFEILLPGAPLVASSTNIPKYLRIFYNWYSKIIDVLPLAFFTAAILNGYGINEKICLAVFSLGILPIFFQLQSKRKGSLIRNYQLLLNFTSMSQLLMIVSIGLQNSNYNVLSLIVSYIFERFFIDEFCYYYDIPSTDLTQYSLCFIEIFAVLTLNEL